MKKSLKYLCVTAVSTALFVVLTMYLMIPVFENYYLCFGYIIMAACLYSYGVVSGSIVGCLGVIIYCLLTSGLRGMPGWTIGNLAIGIILGLTFKVTKKMKFKALQAVINFIMIAISTTIGILILKSLTECILYDQPMVVRIGKNFFAFIADVAILEISLPICMALDRIIK